MTLGVYQTSLSGHHGAYAKAIALAAIERGWKAKLIIPDKCRNHPALHNISEIVGDSNIVYSPFILPSFSDSSRLSLVQFHFVQHQIASKAIALVEGGCDYVYVPTLDQMDQAIRVLGPPSLRTPMGGMCMRIKFHLRSQSKNRLGHKLSRYIGEISLRSLVSSRGLKCLTTADPLLADYASQRKKLMRKVRYVPEIGMEKPSISRNAARQQLKLTPEDGVILLYGAIARRKALPELIAAIEATNFSIPVKILVIGEIDSETNEYFSSQLAQRYIASGRLLIRQGFADESLQAAAFAASDAVWVAYVGHQTMSGVFYQGLCAGLPVIAPSYGVMHSIASKYSVGPAVDVNDPIETGLTIRGLLEHSAQWQVFSKNATALGSAHHPVSFGRAVCDAIAESTD